MRTCEAKLKAVGHKAADVMSAPFRALCTWLLSLATLPMVMAPTLCVTIQSNINMDTLFGNMADIIIKIAFYVGALIAIGGIFSLIVAYKDDNADGQTRAVRLIVVGVVLIGFKTILDIAGIV